ncbi:MAG: hypothetical protein HRU18_01290 [Pseudoalteromonas sp.]|uniref:hypothetical protein n=1 Tax=Pseudoalteromonas sp. TaxID=53249 RepID=UPI001D8CF486|nr:hypothetical protein [Pseudoalteromonas sp.]NRA76814.1 hypothetical protein [Pseudoalteromonas sp.]
MSEVGTQMNQKTYTVEEVKAVIASAMNIDSPLGQKIVAGLEGVSPEEEAKQILHQINHNRFSNSGYIHSIRPDTKKELDKLLDTEIAVHFSNDTNAGFDSDSYEAGYIRGAGLAQLSKLMV